MSRKLASLSRWARGAAWGRSKDNKSSSAGTPLTKKQFCVYGVELDSGQDDLEIRFGTGQQRFGLGGTEPYACYVVEAQVDGSVYGKDLMLHSLP